MYKFEPRGEPPETAYRAIAISQLDKALSDLDRPGTSEPTVVHEARRRTKKLRGLLRLVRAGFAAFDAENAALRDAAGLLSQRRDREVYRETLEALARWRSAPLLDRLLAALKTEAPADNSGALEEFRKRLCALRARAEHWSLSRSGMNTIWVGVRHNYRVARRSMANTKHAPTPEHFHEWRKGNKAHGFQLELLQKAAPAMLVGDLDVVDKLSGVLGQHHDLVVLRAAAARKHLPTMNEREEDELSDLIEKRLAELEHEAFDLGRQIYAEKPRAFVHRIVSYWMTAKS